MAPQTQFKLTPLLTAHGVVGGITAAIPTRGAPFGVLAVFATRPGVHPDEVQFLLTAANTIGMAAERRRAEAGHAKAGLLCEGKSQSRPGVVRRRLDQLFQCRRAKSSPARVGQNASAGNSAGGGEEIAAECLAATGHSRANLETKIGDRTISWSFHPVLSSNVVHCYGEDITDALESGGPTFAVAKDGIRRPARRRRGA